MGFNIDEIFGSAKAAVEQQLGDLQAVGISGGLSYLEDQAIKIIQADKNQHDAKFQTSVSEILARPTTVGSFGDYVGKLAQSPALKEYGPYVLVAVGIGLALAIFIKK